MPDNVVGRTFYLGCLCVISFTQHYVECTKISFYGAKKTSVNFIIAFCKKTLLEIPIGIKVVTQLAQVHLALFYFSKSIPIKGRDCNFAENCFWICFVYASAKLCLFIGVVIVGCQFKSHVRKLFPNKIMLIAVGLKLFVHFTFR